MEWLLSNCTEKLSIWSQKDIIYIYANTHTHTSTIYRGGFTVARMENKTIINKSYKNKLFHIFIAINLFCFSLCYTHT